MTDRAEKSPGVIPTARGNYKVGFWYDVVFGAMPATLRHEYAPAGRQSPGARSETFDVSRSSPILRDGSYSWTVRMLRAVLFHVPVIRGQREATNQKRTAPVR